MQSLNEIQQADLDGPQHQVGQPHPAAIEPAPQSREQIVLDWIVPSLAVALLVAFIASAAVLLLTN
jgi:hypothetical protein